MKKNHPDGTVRLSAVEWVELHFVTWFLFVVKIKEQPKRGSFISCYYIYFVAFLLSFFSFCCSEWFDSWQLTGGMTGLGWGAISPKLLELEKKHSLALFFLLFCFTLFFSYTWDSWERIYLDIISVCCHFHLFLLLNKSSSSRLHIHPIQKNEKNKKTRKWTHEKYPKFIGQD